MSMLLMALALAAEGPPIAAEPYRAQGWEPPWTLTIGDGRLTYETPGARPISVETPSPRSEDGMVEYVTRKIRVTILPGVCADLPSGRRFATFVFVTIGHEEHGGCGGAEIPADSLNGTSWHFTEIGGEPTELTGDLLRDDRYAIDFTADVFVGYTGCNRFSAGYSRTGDILSTKEPWGMGTGACEERIMRLQRRLIEILRAPVRVSFPDANTLVLTGETGTIRLRRTLDEEYGLPSLDNGRRK